MKRLLSVAGGAALALAVCAGFYAISKHRSLSAADAKLSELVSRPDVVAALEAASRHDHSLRHSIDQSWIADYKAPQPNGEIATLMSNLLSRQLQSEALQSDGQIEQIMIFDVAGCLVAADHPTHDYDQSDEDKWKLTVGASVTTAVLEGRDQDPKGITDQASQAVLDEKGTIIGGVTLRWCNRRGGCT